jgi:hypothetical protein
MSLNANNIPVAGGNFERPEPLTPGSYPARVVTIATLGVQPSRPYKGEEKPPVLNILVTYELLDEFLKDEDGNDDLTKPRWLTETFPFYNLSSERAKSTTRYFALDPKGVHKGDWSKLINTPCMVNIVVEEGKGANAGKMYENVDSVAPMRDKDAAKAEPLVNEPVVVDFYAPDPDEVAKLSPWIRKKMALAVDYEGSKIAAIIDKLGDEPKKKPESKTNAPINKDIDDSLPEEDDDADW